MAICGSVAARSRSSSMTARTSSRRRSRTRCSNIRRSTMPRSLVFTICFMARSSAPTWPCAKGRHRSAAANSSPSRASGSATRRRKRSCFSTRSRSIRPARSTAWRSKSRPRRTIGLNKPLNPGIPVRLPPNADRSNLVRGPPANSVSRSPRLRRRVSWPGSGKPALAFLGGGKAPGTRSNSERL